MFIIRGFIKIFFILALLKERERRGSWNRDTAEELINDNFKVILDAYFHNLQHGFL